jgi:CRP-like cAMP-binding protein
MLSRVWLESGTELVRLECRSDWIYFPEGGIVSVISCGADERMCCVGLYGFEGFGNLATILGAPTSATYETVQVAGYAYRISADDMRRAVVILPEFRSIILRYIHVFMMQIANTVLANGTRIEQRLARWLLMCQDRIRGSSLAMTHQSLSAMLGVRRAGVTEAIHVLEGQRLIQARRGLINILDRPGLEKMTAGSYGKPEAEYRRLI